MKILEFYGNKNKLKASVVAKMGHFYYYFFHAPLVWIM
jgi:hypothetical protein